MTKSLTALTAAALLMLTACHSSSPSTSATSSAASSTPPDIILPSSASASAVATSAAPASAPARSSVASAPASTGKSTGATASGGKDPCGLVTGADIAKVTGLAVNAPRPSDVGTQKLCSYSHTDANQDNEFSVLVTLVKDPESRSDFELGRSAAGATTVAGLGTDAYWDDHMDTVYVLAGSLVFEVAVGGANETVAVAGAKSNALGLARIALTRL